MANLARDFAAAAARRSVLIGKAITRFSVLFVGLVIFAALGTELHRTKEVWFDAPVQTWLQAQRSDLLTDLMRQVTHLGDGPVLAAFSVGAALASLMAGHKRAAAFIVFVALGAGLMGMGLKALFSRERPDAVLQLVGSSGFAFPSGHSMMGAAVYGAVGVVMAARYPRLRWLGVAVCALVIVAVGVSRAYLYVHFPSDVVAGWALGISWPLWLKPLVLGHGFRSPTRSMDVEAELEAEEAGAPVTPPPPPPGEHGPLPPRQRAPR